MPLPALAAPILIAGGRFVVIRVGGYLLRRTLATAVASPRVIVPVVRATVTTTRVATRVGYYTTRESLVGATGIGRNTVRSFGRSTFVERVGYGVVRRTVAIGRRSTMFFVREGYREASRLVLTPFYASEAAYGLIRNPRLRRGATSLVERSIDKGFIRVNRVLYDRGLQSSVIKNVLRAGRYYVAYKAVKNVGITVERIQDTVVAIQSQIPTRVEITLGTREDQPIAIPAAPQLDHVAPVEPVRLEQVRIPEPVRDVVEKLPVVREGVITVRRKTYR